MKVHNKPANKGKTFPVEVTELGVSAKIHKTVAVKGGKEYVSYVVAYFLGGVRKQISRSTLDAAKIAAKDACIKVAKGEADILQLSTSDKHIYTRCVEAMAGLKIDADDACRQFAAAYEILGGRVTIIEAAREWMNRNASVTKKITVADAQIELLAELESDKKSDERRKQVKGVLTPFADNFVTTVDTVTPAQVSTYLARMIGAERTKKNHRDVIAFFNRWLTLRDYLPKDTDWLKGVQDYKKTKTGEVEIFTPAEMLTLLAQAVKSQPEMVPFICIAAFSAMRHSEIARLDWAQVDLSDKADDSFIEVLPADGTKAESRRRLVPVQNNLKALLTPYAKKAGKVCPFENTSNQLTRLAEKAGITWKRNAMRHSGISYRVAMTSNVPLIAEESGNSPYVIRTNYLRRVKPAVAAEWFAITLN